MGLLFLGRFDIVRLHSICQSLQPSAAFAKVVTGPGWISPPGRDPHGNDHGYGAIAMFRIYTASRSLYTLQGSETEFRTDCGLVSWGYVLWRSWSDVLWRMVPNITYVRCVYFKYLKHADFRWTICSKF